MKRYTLLPLILLLLFLTTDAIAQSITGYVYNKDKEPIPYANIFIKEVQSGTSTDENGKYFFGLRVGGEYEMVVSSIGYNATTITIVLDDKEFRQDVVLESSSVDLDEIVIKASKKDPAYEIIQNAVKNKKKYLQSVNSFKSEVYVKATEVIDTKDNPKKIAKEEARKAKEAEKKKKEEEDKKEEKTATVNAGGMDDDFDPFAAQNSENQKLLSSLNMVEMQLTLNYQYPKQYKEERSAYKKSGSKAGLFIPLFGEADFNFYRNMVQLEGIAEAPVISPISNTAILSYKYKLIETMPDENGVFVHKIKVIPRKSGNSTVSGYIYINDSIWNINRLDFNLNKGGLRIYDEFNLKLDYEQINDTLWIPYRQEFVYQTKEGKFKTFNGNTTIYYDEYQHNYEFPKRFFSNEVVVTAQDAYEKDSTYWNESRPEPLTQNEQKVIQLRDSISAIVNSKEYKDSVQAEYNKVTFLDLVWDGVGFRNHEKKQSIYFGPIPSFMDFEVVGGFRLTPFASYFRRFENGMMTRTYGRLSLGLDNFDVQGNFRQFFRYNPHKLADVRFGGGRYFKSINNFDAYLNQLRVSNYIINTNMFFRHRIEIVNGLYIEKEINFNNRQSIADLDTESFLNQWITENNEPIDFEDYKAMITNLRLSYTPRQKFMTEPNRKVVLGSDFPTFTLTYRKGWNGPLESAIDFDYLQLTVQQDITFGALGNTKYRVEIGEFINDNIVELVDLRRFRQSDPLLYSDPLRSFQALDTALSTTGMFFEYHHIHHFNGAIVNNIPLLKKTNVRFLAGGGFLYIKENNFRHQELFIGLERVFKLGARRRLRVGVYGVVADGNQTQARPAYKVSFDVIDTWKKDWSF